MGAQRQPTYGLDEEMAKRMTATVAASVVAGAALVGVPGLALASQTNDTERQSSKMGAMMSDPQFRKQMKSLMSEMMSDPRLKQQMRSMMAGMGGTSTKGGGSMSDMTGRDMTGMGMSG